tara:strand:- start:119 stop:574 length:456 start_codon:yes stop_codon:yes gene_type:complete
MKYHKNTLSHDLNHGLAKEKQRQNDFERYFGSLSKTDTFDSFDFTNKHFYIEHKERSIPFGKYDSLFFDKIKYNEYLRLKQREPHKRFIIIWTCRDTSYFWEFTETDEDENGDVVFYFDKMSMDRRKGHGFQTQELCKVFNEHIKPLNSWA